MKKKISQQIIKKYLLEVDQSFTLPLSKSVSITDYSLKVAQNAEHFCYFDKERLAGLVALYCNNNTMVAFITSVSVHPKYRRKGIADLLFSEALAFLKKQNFKEVQLEVATRNIIALQLYKTYGFTTMNENGEGILMKLEL